MLFQLLVELHEYLIILDLDMILRKRFLCGRIHSLPCQQVEPGQMKWASDLFSNEESDRQISLFMRARPVPSLNLAVQIHDENPSTIVLDSLHGPWRKLRERGDGDERSQNVFPYRYL